MSSSHDLLAETAETETVFKILEHLAANGRARKSKGQSPCDARYTR